MEPELDGSSIARFPVETSSAVLRPRLIARLRAEPEIPLAVIEAPSGFGKTTLLSQWGAADERPFVWVSLDQRHEDATLLIGAIAAALDRLEPLGDSVFAPLMAPAPNLWGVVLPRLCDALARRGPPFVLVLDDLHRVRNPAALEPLAEIAAHIPTGSRLAIAAREQDAVPLGRLRVQRGAVELRMTELAMTREEAEMMLASTGLGLGEAALARLLERTEGWPAGLAMASLVLRENEDSEGEIERVCADDRVVGDYLREEFLANLGSDHRVFLTRSSVLDRLSGPACDAVLDREGSAEELRELARSNLLLMPLDRRGRAFRLHSLLRELFESELGALGVAEAAELHRRACEWHVGHGDVERAIEHAIAGGDRGRAADLIWVNAPGFESSGRDLIVRGWLDRFEEAEIASTPPLCIARAMTLTTLGHGIEAEHWASVALEALEGSDGTAGDSLRQVAQLLRMTAAARDGLCRMREVAEEAQAVLPQTSPWRSLCCLLEGVSWHLAGDPERARPPLEDGARRGLASSPNIAALCLAQGALLALDDGDPGLADRHVTTALELADRFGLEEHPTAALVFATGALVGARLGRADEAGRHLRVAGGLLDRLREFSGWYEGEVRIVAARTMLLVDDIPGARARLAEAARHLRDSDDAITLSGWLAQAWADAEPGAVAGRWPLSPAELRLLHQLPTHLTLGEIANELYVSVNTVKTQTRSIYRKLDVSGRAQAVAAARSAGLIDAD